MFIDETIIKVIAGRGGDGCLAYRREKFVQMGGPYGGNGGHGSSIKFKVDTGLPTLIDLRYMKMIKGEKGENGSGKNQNGKNAEDVIIKVPQGTVITDLDTGLIIADMKDVNDEVVVAKVVVVDVVIPLLKRKIILVQHFLKMVNLVKQKY